MIKNHICIIGAGIAGLTLAKLIRDQNAQLTKITIVESGSYEIKKSSQSLNTVKSKGSPYLGLTEGQFRVVGGNSLRWGGQMIPNLPWQLSSREHIGLDSWPLSYDDIYACSSEVKSLMGIPPRDIHKKELKFAKFLGTHIDDHQISEWPPYRKRNFQNLIAKKLLVDSNVTIMTDCTVSKLLLNDAEGERKIVGVSLSDSDDTLEADYFVICAGAIQTTKLLYCSLQNSGLDQPRLGNDFTDHLSTRVGKIDQKNYRKLKNSFSPFFKGSNFYYPRLHLPKKLQEDHSLPGAFLHMQIIGHPGSALENIKTLFRSIQEGKLSLPDFKEIWSYLLELPYFLKLASARFFGFSIPVPSDSMIELFIDIEQLPTSNNCFSEHRSVDATEMEIRLNWSAHENTLRTVGVFLDYLESEIFTPKEIEFERYSPSKIQSGLVDAYHPCGGTVMGDVKEKNVVDTDLKIHGVDNGFILSTSVFPSSATANPTFTLLCLVFRFSKYFDKILKTKENAFEIK